MDDATLEAIKYVGVYVIIGLLVLDSAVNPEMLIGVLVGLIIDKKELVRSTEKIKGFIGAV